MSKLIAAVLFSFALLASACGDDGSSGTATPDSEAEAADSLVSETGVSDTDVPDDSTGDGVDECGQGQAFPDDPDFREAVCRPLMAMLDLIGTDAEIDPEWNTRITSAILGYADRDAAMAQLAAVLGDIEAAG